MKKDYSILIGGQAGQGSRIAARIIAEIFNSLGYKIYVYEAYGSLIRGGHNFSQIRAAGELIEARKEKIDFLLALDRKTIDIHRANLEKGGTVIFNKDRASFKKGIGISIEKMAREMGGKPIMANTALVSAFAKIIGLDWQGLRCVLKNQVRREVGLNLKIARRAFEESRSIIKVRRASKKENLLLTGNEAAAIGMAAAGLEFYFAYPMTPSTSIMNTLAKRNDLGVRVIQPENEISVVNMAQGAAFAGRRSALGTSGGGLALMAEGISLAAQSETPILVIESQRAGPATGIPTYNSQADLLFALSAGHGDIPRFVIAPADAEQSLFYSSLGLNLAWKYQTPVILLLDKDISENTFSVDKRIFKKIRPEKPLLWNGKGEYKRYKITKEGISPLAFPGRKGIVVKNTSYEHDEYGLTIEDAGSVKKMQDKRLRKLEKMRKEAERIPSIQVYGNKNSKTALVSFGISTGAAKEAAESLNIKLVQPVVLEPFPKRRMKEALKGVRKILTVELNATGQLARLLAQNGFRAGGKILKYDGRPFLSKEIKEKIRKL